MNGIYVLREERGCGGRGRTRFCREAPTKARFRKLNFSLYKMSLACDIDTLDLDCIDRISCSYRCSTHLLFPVW